MKVQECMSKDVISAPDNSNVYGIARLMNDNHIGSILICNHQNDLVGMVTDRDIVLRCVACEKDTKKTKAIDIMSENVVTVTPETQICDATKIMAEQQIRRLPVTENNKLVGVISIGDLAIENDVSGQEVGYTMECICHKSKNE